MSNNVFFIYVELFFYTEFPFGFLLCLFAIFNGSNFTHSRRKNYTHDKNARPHGNSPSPERYYVAVAEKAYGKNIRHPRNCRGKREKAEFHIGNACRHADKIIRKKRQEHHKNKRNFSFFPQNRSVFIHFFTIEQPVQQPFSQFPAKKKACNRPDKGRRRAHGKRNPRSVDIRTCDNKHRRRDRKHDNRQISERKITKYAEELAQEQHHGGMQEVIMSTDQAYWQVISLVNKKKLAEGYLKLLQQLDGDVEKMINEGVATKADGLSVRVKVNEAEMTLTKVEDGLSLARMLLCQLCGIDLSSPITLADENMEDIPLLTTDPHFDLSTAYENRPEIRSLELATQIYKQKVNVTRAEHLPSIALMGNYMVTNPSVFNSFENKFKGMWNVGVMVQIPIWHWGEGIYKTRAAKAEARIAQYQLQDAREKIELQVNQAAFKVKEAGKKLVMSSKNMEKAEENLRYATLGFKEGVIATSNVLEAQTAWLSAHSEKIDAQIDVKLTEIYLKKSLGTLK